ncbi:MAG: DUF559 domain-containing protein [Planctomycetota bacterium]
MMDQSPKQTERAKSLRKTRTKAEGLLWSVLRSKQLSGLKFRRQHPVGPYFADLACVSRKLIIELDGPYHDETPQEDLRRETYLRQQGWDVIRFHNDDVVNDIDSVLMAIASHSCVDYRHERRKKKLSGILAAKDPKPR